MDSVLLPQRHTVLGGVSGGAEVGMSQAPKRGMWAQVCGYHPREAPEGDGGYLPL